MSHVWFNLVDSAGRPFKDSTADFVILTPPSNVAQLRKAIKLEYAEILPGITSAQLKVYRSNTDKEPLEEDLDISNIGKTKSDALYVCVPLKQPAGAFSDRLEMSAEECLSHMEQTFAIYV